MLSPCSDRSFQKVRARAWIFQAVQEFCPAIVFNHVPRNLTKPRSRGPAGCSVGARLPTGGEALCCPAICCTPPSREYCPDRFSPWNGSGKYVVDCWFCRSVVAAFTLPQIADSVNEGTLRKVKKSKGSILLFFSDGKKTSAITCKKMRLSWASKLIRLRMSSRQRFLARSRR